MGDLFNSTFEVSLRILLCLNTISPDSASIDRITAYDFVSLYGRKFGTSDTSINGDSEFSFSELPTRRTICSNALKSLALDGFISINRSTIGFSYRISNSGKEYVSKLLSDYSNEYIRAIKKTHQKFSKKSDESIMKTINNKAIESLRRKTYE